MHKDQVLGLCPGMNGQHRHVASVAKAWIPRSSHLTGTSYTGGLPTAAGPSGVSQHLKGKGTFARERSDRLPLHNKKLLDLDRMFTPPAMIRR